MTEILFQVGEGKGTCFFKIVSNHSLRQRKYHTCAIRTKPCQILLVIDYESQCNLVIISRSAIDAIASFLFDVGWLVGWLICAMQTPIG